MKASGSCRVSPQFLKGQFTFITPNPGVLQITWVGNPVIVFQGRITPDGLYTVRNGQASITGQLPASMPPGGPVQATYTVVQSCGGPSGQNGGITSQYDFTFTFTS